MLLLRVAEFSPATAESRNGKAVGRRIGDFFARIVQVVHVGAANVVVEFLDDRLGFIVDRIDQVDNGSRLYEFTVFRMASHVAENHSQIPGAAGASADQTQCRSEIDRQVLDLLVRTAEILFRSACT